MTSKTLTFCLLLAVTAMSVSANSRALDFVGRRAERVSEKKVEKKVWTQGELSPLQSKRFPITDWDKHFSSLGSKRAPVAVDEKKQKERFETRVIDRKVTPIEFSKWNRKLSDLHKQAGISLDDDARIAADRKLYQMALRGTEQFKEMGKPLSLREINRFQFRSNRSAESIPAARAGGSGR